LCGLDAGKPALALQHPRDFTRKHHPVSDVHRDVMTPHMVKTCILKGEGERAGLAIVDTISKTAARGEDARELDEFRREINFAAEVAKRGDPPHQANDVVMGDDFELRRANVMSGLREQRLVVQLIIAEKRERSRPVRSSERTR
jgi:hypothetical protein